MGRAGERKCFVRAGQMCCRECSAGTGGLMGYARVEGEGQSDRQRQRERELRGSWGAQGRIESKRKKRCSMRRRRKQVKHLLLVCAANKSYNKTWCQIKPI